MVERSTWFGHGRERRPPKKSGCGDGVGRAIMPLWRCGLGGKSVVEWLFITVLDDGKAGEPGR